MVVFELFFTETVIFVVPLFRPLTLPCFDTVAILFLADLYVIFAPFGAFFTFILDVPLITILTDFLASIGFVAASTVNPVVGIIEMTIRRDNNRAANLFGFFLIGFQSFLRCITYLVYVRYTPIVPDVW